MSHPPQLQGHHPHQLFFCEPHVVGRNFRGKIENIPKDPATELVQKKHTRTEPTLKGKETHNSIPYTTLNKPIPLSYLQD